MQALIDFDGWRKWKDFATSQNDSKTPAKAAPKTITKTSPKDKDEVKASGSGSASGPADKKRREKRASVDQAGLEKMIKPAEPAVET